MAAGGCVKHAADDTRASAVDAAALHSKFKLKLRCGGRDADIAPQSNCRERHDLARTMSPVSRATLGWRLLSGPQTPLLSGMHVITWRVGEIARAFGAELR